jgi:GNAT superfamily N-acetyltransferase
MSDTSVVLRPALAADAPALAEIFLAARRASLSFLPVVHDDDDVREWFAGTLVPGGHVIAAEQTSSAIGSEARGSVAPGTLLGFADAAPGWLHHLYVAPQAQGRGVGTTLFRRATQVRPEGFDLWVFQRNTGALRFYARHGCHEVLRTDGRDNEEHEPDVRLRWAPGPPMGRRRADHEPDGEVAGAR